ncbi:MAG: OmpA family protein [Salinisphaeraceae bacterium]|nr:OmpA family protein [Salinisphaeraceae bacterium]
MSMRKFTLLVCIFLGSVFTNAIAAEEEGPSVFFQGYYVEPDSDRPTQSRGFGSDLGMSWPLQGNWNLETRLFSNWIDDKGHYRDDAYRAGAALDFRYDLGPADRLSLYLIGGVGVVYNALTPEDNDTNAEVNLGIGWMSKPLNEYGVRLRGDARAVYDDFGDGVVDWRAGMGLQIPLRKPQKEIVEVEKVVYKELPPPPPPTDSDGDGVPDNIDQCPNTPKGALVDARGCQKKLKQDIKETLYLEFDFDKAVVRPSSYPKLENLVSNLRKYPSAKLVLEGHTDSVGSNAYNDKLSQRRAWAVRQVLVSHFGVDPARITAFAYGETSPIASNDTAEGRQKNRRVEAIMKATITQPAYQKQ